MLQTFTQLSPNLWIGQSRLFHTNHGIFISEGQACLIDPGIYPDEIDEIARFVQEQGASPEVIVLTHIHWDHILGPERFPSVRTLAQSEYLTQMRDGSEAVLKSVIAWEKNSDIQRKQPFAIPAPTETFDTSMALMLGNSSLTLASAPGHAPDQLTIYHAESATLWAADMLSDLEIPFNSHDLESYRHTLGALAALDIRILIPGHGHVTADWQEIRNRFSEDIAYQDALRDLVERAIKAGKTLEETVALCAGMIFRNPDENRDPHRWNVESAYIKFGGEADPKKAGWEQDWDS